VIPSFDPPDGELREPSEGSRGERDAVIGEDPLGKAVFLEQVLEAAAGQAGVDTVEAVALEQEAGMAVLDGERVAESAIAGPKLTLEVCGPGGVGCIHGRCGTSRMGMSAPGLTMVDEFVLDEDAVNGVDGRDGVQLVPKFALNLGRSPAPGFADLEDALDDRFGRQVRAGARTVGAILESSQAFLAISSQPLVPGGPGDPVAAAELREGEE
jgi:hypothetical protein